MADTESYIITIQDSATEELIVAEYQETVVAWMQLSYMLRAESGYFMEITGLVVDKHYRSAGIGNKMIEFAKEYCI